MSGTFKFSKLKKQFIHSIVSLKRNLWMSIVSITATTILLGLVGVFTVVLSNTSKLADDIENNVQISVYLDANTNDNSETIKDAENKDVANENYHKIYDQIDKLKNVKSIEWSSKDDQLAKLIENMGDTWSVFKDMQNPLYDVYIVSANDAQNVKALSEELAKIESVVDVQYGDKNVDKVLKIASLTKLYGFVGILLFIVIAVFLIYNTIKATIFARQEEIQIYKLVGARDGFIRMPFVFEGLWIGLLGSILPIVLISYAYNVIYTAYNATFVSSGLSLLTPNDIVFKTALLIVAVGVGIGINSSLISMNKYLKI